MLPPIPWPGPRAINAMPQNPLMPAAAGALMPAVMDRIMNNRPSPSPALICKTCGHEWGSHKDGRCAHLFGMEGDFAHICGCSPDERGELYPPLPGELGPAIGGIAATVAAAAVMMSIRR